MVVMLKLTGIWSALPRPEWGFMQQADGQWMVGNWAIDFQSVIRLVTITTVPTPINIAFKGSLPTSLAAMGAAISPPIIRPATSVSGRLLRKIKKVIELARTMKNSARQTEPIT